MLKKKNRRFTRAIIKWPLLLLLVFCLSFLAAGGGNFILPDKKMPDKKILTDMQDAAGSLRRDISNNIANITDNMDNMADMDSMDAVDSIHSIDTTAIGNMTDIADIADIADITDITDITNKIDINNGAGRDDAPLKGTAEGSHADAAPPSALDRLSRLIFLREAVEKRVSQPDYVRLQDIPEAMQQAVIAVEDRKFYSHWGFDMEGIFRASLVNMQYGEVREGASTITQQLVKNLFLSQEQTMGRKAEEFLLALDMEINYSKEEILELYLNSIYFGSGYYGIGQAARGYFGKEPAMLSLPEAAMLAGIPNAPSLYSPYVDFMLAKKRQFVVLDAMTAAGFLRENVAEDAKIRPIELAH